MMTDDGNRFPVSPCPAAVRPNQHLEVRGMLPLTPQLHVSTATALGAWDDRRVHDTDDDRAIADCSRGDNSLGFVHFAGFWSHIARDIKCSSWPLLQCERLEEVAALAEEHEELAPTPLAGDLFLLASPGGDRHVLAGVVLIVETVTTLTNGCIAFLCVTAEGALDVPAAGEFVPSTASARLVRRRLSPVFGDCFIRWSELPA